MVLLENDPFLTELGKLYLKAKANGTVFITFKRVTDGQLLKGKKKAAAQQQQTKTEPKADPDPEGRCLIRATSGKKKISTIVKAKDVIRFQLAFINIQRLNMDNLKKKQHGKRGKKARE